MKAKQDYVVEVYAPQPTFLTLATDEDDETAVPPMTTDPEIALRFEAFKDARGAVREAAARYPSNSFKVGVLPPLVSASA